MERDYSHLIGKRISVIDPKWGEMVGICFFAGINTLHGKFQVTLDRMPLWPINPNTIKVINKL